MVGDLYTLNRARLQQEVSGAPLLTPDGFNADKLPS